MEVERCTDADEHGRREGWPKAVHPTLLFRGTQANPDDICTGRIQAASEFFFFLGGQRPVGRRECARDEGSGETIHKLRGKQFGYSRGSSVEEMPIAFFTGASEEFQHEFWSIHAARNHQPLQTSEPDQGCSVRYNEIRGMENGTEAGIALCLHHAVHSRHGDVAAALAPRDPVFHDGNNFGDLESIDADIEHRKFCPDWGMEL